MVTDPMHGRPVSEAFVDTFGVAGDGGPDCPFCGREQTTTVCHNEECPGEVLQCEAIVFHASRNPDSAMFGQDETCENDAEPGSTVCVEHRYVLDEPPFATTPPPPVTPRPAHLDPWHEPYLRVRSDNRFEVADEQYANEQFGCLVDSECILSRDHDGTCCEDREVWAGPDALYEHPHRFE